MEKKLKVILLSVLMLQTLAFAVAAQIEKTYYENGKVKSEGNMLNGDFRSYYENGQIAMEGNFKDGQPWDGMIRSYREDGTLIMEQNYKEGLLLGKNGLPMTGVVQIYYDDGKLQDECPYKDGKRHGISKSYKKDGTILELGWNQGQTTGYYKAYHEKGDKP